MYVGSDEGELCELVDSVKWRARRETEEMSHSPSVKWRRVDGSLEDARGTDYDPSLISEALS